MIVESHVSHFRYTFENNSLAKEMNHHKIKGLMLVVATRNLPFKHNDSLIFCS